MKKADPFFSIIIPTYNRMSFINQTIQSVLEQSFDTFEVIVVDDGGTDNTSTLIERFNDERLTYYWKTNGERGAARNYGWQKAKGKYVTFLDSDDLLYKNHLQAAQEFIFKKKEPCCFAQAHETRRVNDNAIIREAFQTGKETINKELIKGNLLSCFGIFIKNEIFSSLHFEEDRRFAGTEDWLLWLQLSARYPFYYNNEITGALLQHDLRSVLSFDEESLIFRTDYLKQKLKSDRAFAVKYGNKIINKIYAHMLTYTALHLAMSKKRKQAAYYWWKAIREGTSELFTHRSLVITKKILFS